MELNKRYFADCAVGLFLALLFYVKVFPIPVIVGNILVALVGIVSLLYVCRIHFNDARIGIGIVFSCVASMLFSISMLANHNSSLEDLAWVWVYLGPVLLVIMGSTDTAVFRNVFYLVAAYIVIQALLGASPNDLFSSGSRNGISSNIVFYAVLYMYFGYKDEGRVRLIPSVFALLVCIYGEGRSGLIVGFGLLAISIIAYLVIQNNVGIGKILFIIILCWIAYIIIREVLGDNIEYLLDRFSNEQLDTARTRIWSDYFDLVFESPLNVIFGGPILRGSVLLTAYSGNLHNSILMLHSKFGLIGLIGVLLLLFLWFRDRVSNKLYFPLALITILLIRSLVDWVAFTGQYDFMFLYIMLSVIISGANQVEKRNAAPVRRGKAA